MDAFSMCSTSPAHRSSSKIYQDLGSARLSRRLAPVDCDQLLCRAAAMDAPTQRGGHGRGLEPHVAVIGAGLSGFRCADVLLKRGFKVTIIEARDRIGGRVHQETLANGHLVDVGPNWIHGTSDNPIHDLARQTKTAVGRWNKTAHVFDEQGALIPAAQGQEYSDVMWDIIQDALQHSSRSSPDIDKTRSLSDFFRQATVDKIPQADPDHERKRRIVLQLSEAWGAFVGSPVSQQSLKFFWLEECIEGENLFCAGTYKKMLDAIAKPTVTQAEVMLDTRAQRIRCRRVQPGEKIQVQVVGGAAGRGGQTLSFDEVVVTCPLGWLKRNLDSFEPALPARLVQAVESIGYGSLEKVYISFAEAFWLSQKGDDGTAEGFIQWLAPDYAPESNPDKWNQEAVELASLAPPEFAHPTLLFYVYGPQSAYLTASTAQFKDQTERDGFVLDFFKPYYSRLPHYSATSDACQPTGCLATAWMRDEFAGFGSYTNFQVGLERGDEDIETMREGLPDRGLWFAGEHTAPFVTLGTATGAYWSGESVGQRMAEAYGLPPRPGKSE